MSILDMGTGVVTETSAKNATTSIGKADITKKRDKFSQDEWIAIYNVFKNNKVEFSSVSYGEILKKLEIYASTQDAEKPGKNTYTNFRVAKKKSKNEKKDPTNSILSAMLNLDPFVAEYFANQLNELGFLDGDDMHKRLQDIGARFCTTESKTDFIYWIQSDKSNHAIGKYLRIYKPENVPKEIYSPMHPEFWWVELKELPK